MSLIDKTAHGQTDAIVFEIELPHASEKVWRALTEPKLLAEWLLPVTGMVLAPGAEFRFEAPPMPGWDGLVHCRILAIDALKELRYGWVVGDLDTEVTFTLTPTVSGTRLSIVQTGFKADQKKNFGGARYGWRTMGGKLIDVLERIP